MLDGCKVNVNPMEDEPVLNNEENANKSPSSSKMASSMNGSKIAGSTRLAGFLNERDGSSTTFLH